MIRLSCPSCGAEVNFRSASSIFAVCEYCRSMLVRKDMDLQALGKMALLQEDMSPLKVGTQGRYEKTSFSIVGRLRIRWEEGAWNEWFLLFDDGREGWLGEAQGFYMVSFPVLVPPLPPLEEIKVGLEIKLQDTLYQIDDIKEVCCEGSEGELPFQAPKGRKSTSIDLTGPDRRFACLDYSKDGIQTYAGSYVDFDSLKFQFLREINGW